MKVQSPKSKVQSPNAKVQGRGSSRLRWASARQGVEPPALRFGVPRGRGAGIAAERLGLRQSSGAFDCAPSLQKRQRTGALQNASAPIVAEHKCGRVSSFSRFTFHVLGSLPRPSQRGIALIIVMISIFVLATMALGFAYAMRVETTLAANANSEAELEWLGRSGVEYCRWILAQQLNIREEPYDALNQVWAGGIGGIGTSNSALMDVQNPVKIGSGSFHWKITDLESKWNINMMAQPNFPGEDIMKNAFLLMNVDAGASTPVVNSILNWIDRGSRLQGAEGDYYQGQSPKYSAKEGPIDDLSELLLVKGISEMPELYWGGVVTNHPPPAFQARLRTGGLDQGQVLPYGLVDLFAPLSSGKVNVNTASEAVLQLIPGIDAISAEKIVAGRSGEDDLSGMTGPYRSLAQLDRVPELPRGMGMRLQQFCDVRSRTFQIEIEAQIGNYKRQFIAIVGRNSPRDVQILSFYWK
ncbi:MAG: hypothetical protein C5B50_29705 [Verrucomicrobia bacterium]|nr:MAG: hypothetical protein C5B50_29705 [Verrucomicrobiota bacterium]